MPVGWGSGEASRVQTPPSRRGLAGREQSGGSLATPQGHGPPRRPHSHGLTSPESPPDTFTEGLGLQCVNPAGHGIPFISYHVVNRNFMN